jgi:hypothetical protein
MGRKATDLSGVKVGKLTVVKRAYYGRAKEGLFGNAFVNAETLQL